jgi:hypothetical protein
METRSIIASEVEDARMLDPCDSIRGAYPVDVRFVARAKAAYGMPNPTCGP